MKKQKLRICSSCGGCGTHYPSDNHGYGWVPRPSICYMCDGSGYNPPPKGWSIVNYKSIGI